MEKRVVFPEPDERVGRVDCESTRCLHSWPFGRHNVFQAAAQLSEQVGVCCCSAGGHATVDAQAAAAMESAPSPQCDHPKLQGKRGCGEWRRPFCLLKNVWTLLGHRAWCIFLFSRSCKTANSKGPTDTFRSYFIFHIRS